MAVTAVNMCAAWPLLGWNCDRRFAGSEHHSTILPVVQAVLRPTDKSLDPDHASFPHLRRVGASVHRSDSTAHLLIETTSGHVDVLRLDPQLAPPRFQRPSLGCRPERRTHPRASHRRVHTDVGHPYALGADRGERKWDRRREPATYRRPNLRGAQPVRARVPGGALQAARGGRLPKRRSP